MRITPPASGQLAFITTGNPEVVIARKDGDALYPLDERSFAGIRDETEQMCAAMAIFLAYPPRLVAVRNPSGVWEVAY